MGHHAPMTRWLPWTLVIGSILLTGAIRLRLLNVPLERDEGEYAYAGQLMLERVPPYKAACNMTFPGTYATPAHLVYVNAFHSWMPAPNSPRLIFD